MTAKNETTEILAFEIKYCPSPEREDETLYKLFERTSMDQDEIIEDFADRTGALVEAWRQVIATVETKSRWSTLKVVSQLNGEWQEWEL